MTEYWLQKKSLGGWSTVTWYSDLEQARTNYQRCLEKGMSGYSWRLVSVDVVEVAMLEEVTEVEAPSLERTNNADLHIKEINKPSANVVNPKPANTGWGKVIKTGWGDIPSASLAQHGLTGSVWVVHHGLKEKKRVAAGELDAMLAQGYERGGPKTKFRE